MKLVLSGNRVIGYGENLISMGGTVIDTDANKVYQNATVAECDGCPSDIDLVGYEYHAGTFVPCAPYASNESGGEIMVACDNCATPRKSGIKIDDAITNLHIFTGTVEKNETKTLTLPRPPRFIICSVSKDRGVDPITGFLVPDNTVSPPPSLNFFEKADSLGVWYFQVYFDSLDLTNRTIELFNQVDLKYYSILAFC